jgi:hypothetical protein
VTVQTRCLHDRAEAGRLLAERLRTYGSQVFCMDNCSNGNGL